MSLARVQSLSKPLGLQRESWNFFQDPIYSFPNETASLLRKARKLLFIFRSFPSHQLEMSVADLHCFQAFLGMLEDSFANAPPLGLSLYGVFKHRQRLVSSFPHSTMLHLQVFSTSWRFFPPMLFQSCFIPNPPLRFCFQGFPPFRSRHSFRRALPLEQRIEQVESSAPWE
jgi:hypothetical protein